MSTIDELMAGKKPGEIKVRRPVWEETAWFQPYYKFENYWMGPTDRSDSARGYDDCNDWVLCWGEKITRWFWLARGDDGKFTLAIYSEEEAKQFPFLKKLEWSKMEMDE